MDVSTLIIETTRRCNMTCGHCLRGDAQNLDMPYEYLDRLFSQLGNVGTITLTGGEPSLVPEKILEIVELIKRHRVSVDGFYAATNGLEVSEEFIMALIRMHQVCEDKNLCSVDMSVDQYHMEDEPYRLRPDESPLHALAFFGYKNEIYETYPLIREGRSADCGDKEAFGNALAYEGGRVNEDLYLNCRGNLMTGCDWSYETQDDPERIICHVDDDIEAALEERMEKQYEEEAEEVA